MIDVNAPQFQLGHRLYDAQVTISKLNAGETIPPARIEELAKQYCELINWCGQLRAEYSSISESSTKP